MGVQEVRQLRLKAKELQQQLQQQQKRCKVLPQLAEEAAELKEQLAKEKVNVKRLRLELGKSPLLNPKP